MYPYNTQNNAESLTAVETAMDAFGREVGCTSARFVETSKLNDSPSQTALAPATTTIACVRVKTTHTGILLQTPMLRFQMAGGDHRLQLRRKVGGAGKDLGGNKASPPGLQFQRRGRASPDLWLLRFAKSIFFVDFWSQRLRKLFTDSQKGSDRLRKWIKFQRRPLSSKLCCWCFN